MSRRKAASWWSEMVSIATSRGETWDRKLAAARALRAEAEHLEHHVAEGARRRGVTWDEIGDVYGITRQGAERRFGHGH